MLSWRSTRRIFPVVLVTTVLATGLVVSSNTPTDAGVAPSTLRQAPAKVYEHDVPGAKPSAPDTTTNPVPKSTGDATSKVVAELPETTVEPFSMVGVTWTSATNSADLVVQVRWRDKYAWSAWTELEVDLENTATEGGRPGTEPQWVGKADAVAVRVTSVHDVQPVGLRVATINPGASEAITPVAFQTDLADVTPAADVTAASVSQPAIIGRSAWGASNGTSCNSPVYGGTTKGAVINHTAGNNSYTKAQSASIVKSTQAYHVGSRKWCDIGYNFLVDKYGQTFEGRKGGIDKTVRGAHSGNGPVNEETMGVALMGTHTSTEATAAAKTAVVDLVSWRFSAYKVPAKGTYSLGGLRLNRIAGHRNVVSTECPGAKVYAWLSATGGLRDRVADELAQPAQTKPVVQGLRASNVSTTAATLSWSAVSGAAKYRIYVMSTTPMPAACETNCRVITPVVLSSPSYRLSGLATGANYYVKVSALNAAGATLTGWQPDPLRVDLPGATAAASNPAAPTVTRLAGDDRYETAAAISAKTYAPGFDAVFVATGSGFADGLSGGPGAAKLNSPLLLTPSDRLPAAVAAEISRLKPKKIYILGGEAVVNSQVESALRKLAPGGTTRLAGSNRYGTAAKVASLWSGAGTVYLASGVGFADALSGGGAAAKERAPLLLTATNKLPAETLGALKTLKPSNVILVGGTGAVSNGVSDVVKSALPGASVTRVGGVDRYETSAKLLTWSWSGSISKLMLASGASFPDALGGVPTSAAIGAAFALSDPRCLPPSVATAKGSAVGQYLLLGGTSVLNSAVTSTTCKPKAVDSAGGATVVPSNTNTGNNITVPSSRTFDLSGHGFGHGIGMSQYGAQNAASNGQSYGAIIRYYYPGTTLTGVGNKNIRVLISKDTSSSVDIKRASTGWLKFRNVATGNGLILPSSVAGIKATQWRIVPDPAKRTQSLLQANAGGWKNYDQPFTAAGQFEASEPMSLVMPDGSSVRYRGTLRSAIPTTGSGIRDTVNVLGIDDYTRGVIAAEMPSSWKPNALRAQAAAARTYGYRSVKTTGYYDICDTTSCQVYRGVSVETANTDAAVAVTSNKVITYQGKPAFTQFSSSSGGYSAVGSQPYLQQKADKFDDWSGNPVHDWKVTVKASTLEKAYPTVGTLKTLTITARTNAGEWGGRVNSFKLTGSKGTKTITGNDVRWALGLRSNWFRFS